MGLDKDVEKEKGLPLPVIAGAAVVIIAVVVFIVLGQKKKFEPVVAGSEVIDFTLPDLDGYPTKLSDFKGKVVFLNFWATWCKPCEDEMPSMQMLYETLEGEPFEIVAVSVDSESADVVKEFVEKYGITFTVLHDRKGRVKETYKTTGVPETFIVDQNGYVAEKFWGPRDWTEPDSIRTINDLLFNGPRDPSEYKNKGRG
ncbi:MAG: TlpA disulfide reductase family protein [Thermodesulfobacteriota bacterium]